MSPGTRREVGLVYTFYSYKGGVGRTMAVANVAALLAKWGRSVLVVDWDLEAPGIERFFLERNPSLLEQRRATPGVADLISAKADGKDLDWSKCLLQAKVPDSSVPVSILSAGRDDECYSRKVQSFDFEKLFAEHGLGDYVEKLRQEWTSQFEFVLIDSRTGISDIGGICTIHLPDILVLLFTTTHPSLDGVLDVLKRARAGQQGLPFTRARLIGVPVPAREESRTANEMWLEWREIIAKRCEEVYKDWLPIGKTASEVLDRLRIPYIPYWSFGERLPVIEHGTSDPGDLGFWYEVLARLIAADLAWKDAVPETLPPDRLKVERARNDSWFDGQWRRPKKCMEEPGRRGFMEFSFYSPNESFDLPQDRLLAALRVAATKEIAGWDLVTVSQTEDRKPRSTGDGAVADTKEFYWAANGQGDFYGLGNFFEDERPAYHDKFLVRHQALWIAEAVLFSRRFFWGIGANGNCQIRFGLRYGGLKGRRLTMEFGRLENYVDHEVEAVSSEAHYFLSELDENLPRIVQRLFDPVCVVFDFFRPTESFYSQLIRESRGLLR
jgi:hypothetical protein